MRRGLLAAVTAALLFLPGARAANGPDPFWSYWGDGKAELDGYRLVQPRYGEPRTGTAVLIFVTEDHSIKERVKIEGDSSSVPADEKFSVLKLNSVRSFQTGIYPYHVLTSVFARVDDAFVPSKISLSVQEWCGHVYHQMRVDEKEINETLHSYFGGEGDQTHTYDRPAGAVFEDDLPILIRELKGPWLAPGTRRPVPLAPSLLGLRFAHQPFAWTTATVAKAAKPETLRTALGEKAAMRWTVATPTATWTYFVERDVPHRILRWSNDKGESAEITGSARLPYWKLHDNGGEKYLEELGVKPLPDAAGQREKGERTGASPR